MSHNIRESRKVIKPLVKFYDCLSLLGCAIGRGEASRRKNVNFDSVGRRVMNEFRRSNDVDDDDETVKVVVARKGLTIDV